MAGFWSRLFGGGRKAPELSPEARAARFDSAVKYLRDESRACLRIEPCAESRSWLAGPADEAAGLVTVARLDFAEMAAAAGPDWLPVTGAVTLRVDPDRFDGRDRGGFQVERVEGVAPPPAGASAQAVTFVTGLSYPIHERSWGRLGELSEEEDERIAELLGIVEREPDHMVGGYPTPIQSDAMEAECQEAWTAGWVTGARETAGDAEDWRLLAQIDSDDALGTNWYDGGRLYFWIREADARAGDFSRCWLTIQFY